METKCKKIRFSKSTNKTGSISYSANVVLPASWVREMGLSKEDKDVVINFDGRKIIIKKGGEKCLN